MKVCSSLSSNTRERFSLWAQVCIQESERTVSNPLWEVQSKLKGDCTPKKRPSLEREGPGREERLAKAYSRQAALAVWTGPLSAPSPSQQYNGPVATGSPPHCVSSPGPPQLKRTQAPSMRCSRRRGGKAKQGSGKILKEHFIPLARSLSGAGTAACSCSTVKMALLLPHSRVSAHTPLPPLLARSLAQSSRLAHSTPPLFSHQ